MKSICSCSTIFLGVPTHRSSILAENFPLFQGTLLTRDSVLLAKAAHLNDLELNPRSHDWEFAFNVLKLNHHPMCWLLQWAGVKLRRPWWHRWLLMIAALVFIISTTCLMLVVMNQPRAL